MTAIAIESATVSDRDSLLALLAAQLAEHEIPITAERLAAGVDWALANPDRARFLVARDGAHAIGVAYLSFAWPMEIGALIGFLEEIYVEPTRRNRGIGNLLLDAVVAVSRAAGAVTLDLEVEESHERAANLYRRRGFRCLPRRHWTLAL